MHSTVQQMGLAAFMSDVYCWPCSMALYITSAALFVAGGRLFCVLKLI